MMFLLYFLGGEKSPAAELQQKDEPVPDVQKHIHLKLTKGYGISIQIQQAAISKHLFPSPKYQTFF